MAKKLAGAKRFVSAGKFASGCSRTTISVPSDLKALMDKYGHLFNWSEIARKAWMAALEKGAEKPSSDIDEDWSKRVQKNLDRLK